MEELELTRMTMEGIRGEYRTETERDVHMKNHIQRGFDAQSWRYRTWWGDIKYGFSYSKTRKLTTKQKAEFERLKNE